MWAATVQAGDSLGTRESLFRASTCGPYVEGTEDGIPLNWAWKR